MTKSPDAQGSDVRSMAAGSTATRSRDERCRWCGRKLPQREGPGRPRRYCRAGCRQAAHLARKFAAAHGLADHDVIVDRERVEEIQGLLYCLQAAVEDVDRDLSGSKVSAREVREALDWLLDNARPLASAWIELAPRPRRSTRQPSAPPTMNAPGDQ